MCDYTSMDAKEGYFSENTCKFILNIPSLSLEKIQAMTCIPLFLRNKTCVYINYSSSTNENSRPIHNTVSRYLTFSVFWLFRNYKSKQTLLGKSYAKSDAETDLFQNMKGSFDWKRNTNVSVRLEYKVSVLKQKSYDKSQC